MRTSGALSAKVAGHLKAGERAKTTSVQSSRYALVARLRKMWRMPTIVCNRHLMLARRVDFNLLLMLVPRVMSV